MKKKTLIVFIFLAGTLIALFIFFGKALLPTKELILDQTNKTFVVKGDVRIKKPGENSGWKNMDASTVLEKGDVVETGKDSSVDIVIGSNTEKTLKLCEKSHVEFQGVNPANLNVSGGKIFVTLKKLESKSSFVIKTPTAICGARGTAWVEEVTPDRTKTCVFESGVFAHEVGANGKPRRKEYVVDIGTQRTFEKDKPISAPEPISDLSMSEWKYWNKNITYLREGKILVNDFDRKENFNNLGGAFGSWNMFYWDTTQHCRDSFSETERVGNTGYGLKLDYDVDSTTSSYNGFFTNLMGIDLSKYNYLVFYIKGDATTGFTTKINLELKNRLLIGKTTLEGITDQWKRMVIPFSRFVGINDLTEMKEFVIVFSDINVTKKEGVIYLDDIYFTKTEPTD